MHIITENYIKVTHLMEADQHNHTFFSSTDDFIADMFCIALNNAGLIENDGDVVFYNNFSNENHSIELYGDCISGCTECGNYSVSVNFADIPMNIQLIVVLSHMYEDQNGVKMTFHGIKNIVHISRLQKPHDCQGDILLRHSIQCDLKDYSSVILCKLLRNKENWIIDFPKEVGIPMTFLDYLKSVGLEI